MFRALTMNEVGFFVTSTTYHGLKPVAGRRDVEDLLEKPEVMPGSILIVEVSAQTAI